MRRSDREITDSAQIIEIIEKCDVCRLALSDGAMPYIVPLNYGYEYANGKLTLYFHGAKKGRKMEIIERNPLACFEMDCSHRLIEAEQACGYTMEYESVIGSGKIYLCTDKAEKVRALAFLMGKYAGGREFEFPDSAVEAVAVFRLEVAELKGKRLKVGG